MHYAKIYLNTTFFQDAMCYHWKHYSQSIDEKVLLFNIELSTLLNHCEFCHRMTYTFFTEILSSNLYSSFYQR